MVIVALLAAWVVVACVAALLLGRSLAISGKSDRWRHGRREVRDLRRLHPVVPAAPASRPRYEAA